jgi:hypothetical protein
MFHLKINMLKILVIFEVILSILINSRSLYSQKTSEANISAYQKYIFENNDLVITLESNSQFIYENDSCQINFAIRNKTNKDIYILEGSGVFLFSSCDNKLQNVILSYGGSFDGGIDYDVYLIKIKPNFLFSNQAYLLSDKIKKFSSLSDFNIKFNFGYLESDKIDSLRSCCPENTNIKTEKISENELKTSAYALYLYWKMINVGSLLIKYLYR